MLDLDALPDRATQDQMAQWLGIAPATLRTWHEKGTAPPKVKLGKKVYYHREQVAVWLHKIEAAAA